MRRTPLLAGALLLAASAVVLANDDNPLKEALEDHLVSAEWIYDDIEKGFAEAQRTGKPLLVAFRCVP